MSPASAVRVPKPEDMDAPLRTARLEEYGCVVALVPNGYGQCGVLQRALGADGKPTGDWGEVLNPGPDESLEREALDAALDALGVDKDA